MAGEDWFEVYEGEGLGGLVEDLVVVSSWYECLSVIGILEWYLGGY